MSNFKSPTKITIAANSYISDLLSSGLEKDLHGNEHICDYCHGTGMVKADNVYGLSDDPNKSVHFPYKHQSITFCPRCYNGVVQHCEYCGEILSMETTVCTCETAKRLEQEKRDAAVADAFKSAEEFVSDALGLQFDMCYSAAFGQNDGFFSSWDDFFAEWGYMVFDSVNAAPQRPEYVWGTTEEEMKLDANSIVEAATYDLYEDADSDISGNAMSELQTFLDNWCKQCGVRKTYHASNKFKVKIPWELYDVGNNDPKVYQIDNYSWLASNWSFEKTIAWYQQHINLLDADSINRIEECDIDSVGMWCETTDPADIERLGDADRLGTQSDPVFEDLCRSNGSVYKFVSFRTALQKLGEFTEPIEIASTEWC